MALFRRVSTLLEFQKPYNTLFFLIFTSPFFLFTLSQVRQCFTAHGIEVSRTPPGEMYWFVQGRERIGIKLHLASVLPCGCLTLFQFIPVFRRNAPGFHRVNGRVILVLLLLANVGALMIARRAFGGTVDIQTAVGFLVVIATIGAGLASYNIRKLQIEQHRAWMLRTMFYMGTVVTARVILIASALTISATGGYRNVWPCEMVEHAWKSHNAGNYLEDYPQCAGGTGFAIVDANLMSERDPAQIGTSFQMSFGTALWLSIVLHMIGVEMYLNLTPRETNRLRLESFRRQQAAGYKNPGSEGLVAEKFGDAHPWVPESRQWKQVEGRHVHGGVRQENDRECSPLLESKSR